jgi:hypothetical protein
MPKRNTKGQFEAADELVAQDEPVGIGELNKAEQPIEKASEGDIGDEAFMNDVLTILVHEGTEESDNEVIIVNCNGTNQPIVRGQRIPVKRKYVEILARSRKTTYRQQVHDPSQPHNIQMIPKSVLFYPFTVYHDPHPDGREWLQQILDQPI